MVESEEVTVERSSGNVFADLGFADPEEALVKATLVTQIQLVVKGRNLTQVQAGKLVGMDQPTISAMLRGHISRFSVERLLKVLTDLGQDVELRITPASEGRGRLHVAA
jgi:predicted XRE-type DNA-binding protein